MVDATLHKSDPLFVWSPGRDPHWLSCIPPHGFTLTGYRRREVNHDKKDFAAILRNSFVALTIEQVRDLLRSSYVMLAHSTELRVRRPIAGVLRNGWLLLATALVVIGSTTARAEDLYVRSRFDYAMVTALPMSIGVAALSFGTYEL